MYEIALAVAACLRANTRVGVAWVVEGRGLDPGVPGEALALTPGGGRVGSLLAGAINEQLADLGSHLADPKLVDLEVSELDAAVAGLSSTGWVRVLLVPADSLPAELWGLLVDREPVCLVTQVRGGEIGATTLFTPETIGAAGEKAARLFSRRVTRTSTSESEVVTVLWPVPRLVIVGGGPLAEALSASARLLGWHPQMLSDVREATAEIGRLAGLDKVVVMSHDDEVAGPVLMAALAGRVGYIGALGSRRVQQGRAAWLAGRGVTDLARIHGPAGFDIGATTPSEIAVSILAEALAVGSGKAQPADTERRGVVEPSAQRS